MNYSQKSPHIASFLFILPLPTILIVMFSPMLVALANTFQISAASAKATIVVSLLGYAIGPLIYGPLSNRFGRKPALYLGLTVTLLGLVIDVVATQLLSYELFLIGRVITTLGAVAGMTLSFAMIGDCFEPEKARKVTTLSILSFGFLPGLVAILSGYMTQHVTWEIMLYFGIIYVVLMAIIVYFIPETHHSKNPHALNLKKLLSGYGVVIKSRNMLILTLITGMCTSVFYIYAAQAPFIGIHLIGLKTSTFGLLNFFPYIIYLISLIINAKIAHRKSYFRLVMTGVIPFALGGVIMLLCYSWGVINIWTLFIPSALVLFGMAPIMPSTIALAISEFSDKGSASAFNNFGFVTVSMLITFVTSNISLVHGLIYPVAIIIAVLITSLVVFHQFVLKSV